MELHPLKESKGLETADVLLQENREPSPRDFNVSDSYPSSRCSPCVEVERHKLLCSQPILTVSERLYLLSLLLVFVQLTS
jgi:hypothetical protein